MVLWMKVGAMIGIRQAPAASFRWDYVVVACVLAALLMLAAQALWGLIGPLVANRLGGETSPRRLRLVWGASSFPHVFAVAFLLPLDLVIVGSDTFTSERLTDPVAMIWAAVSVSIGLSLAIWSGFLLVRGSAVGSSIGTARGLIVAASAAACLALVSLGAYLGLIALAGWAA
jgi:hypothetical protein